MRRDTPTGTRRGSARLAESPAGSPGVTPVAEVLTGRAHYGVANSELLLQRLRGQPLVALASINSPGLKRSNQTVSTE